MGTLCRLIILLLSFCLQRDSAAPTVGSTSAFRTALPAHSRRRTPVPPLHSGRYLSQRPFSLFSSVAWKYFFECHVEASGGSSRYYLLLLDFIFLPLHGRGCWGDPSCRVVTLWLVISGRHSSSLPDSVASPGRKKSVFARCLTSIWSPCRKQEETVLRQQPSTVAREWLVLPLQLKPFRDTSSFLFSQRTYLLWHLRPFTMKSLFSAESVQSSGHSVWLSRVRS